MTNALPALLLLLLVPGPASAQNAGPSPVSGAQAPVGVGALSLDTPIEQIAASPAGKAVLDKDVPGLITHPAYEQFKSLSIKDVQPMSQGAITDSMIKRLGADLASLHQ